MNQVSNLIQWKNLTQEQKDEYDFENYKYEYQEGQNWYECIVSNHPISGYVYRMVIEPDKWYAIERRCNYNYDIQIIKGSDIRVVDQCYMVRPAKPDEIPKPERVFKDGAYYPVICKDGEQDIAYYDEEPDVFDTCHYGTCEFRAFSWIGEELKIDWGKE